MIMGEINKTGDFSKEKIVQILKKYKIGKKPLAQLLGWGENTIVRYLNGGIPSKKYQETLEKIYQSPMYFLQILTRYAENITKLSYRKSKKAVLEQIMETRVDAFAQYIINCMQGQVSPIAIQSMLYYVQGFSLGLYGSAAFQEKCIFSFVDALDTFVPYYRIFEAMTGREIHCIPVAEELLSRSEKVLVQSIVAALEWYGKKTFMELLLQEKRAVKFVKDQQGHIIVTQPLLKKRFEQIVKRYHIESVDDIATYIDYSIKKLKKIGME